MYLALNGAVHDAAVAAWGAKGYYDSVAAHLDDPLHGRPRAVERSRRARPTTPTACRSCRASSRSSRRSRRAPGERHEALAEHVGEVAIRAWTGQPEDPRRRPAACDWIRAVEWVPYQLPTFVTPAFAGYASGHSTFSRAAAEVMTAITGSQYVPGGHRQRDEAARRPRGRGRTDPGVELQWASYYDAADQAGLSRLLRWHPHHRPTTSTGRRIGSPSAASAAGRRPTATSTGPPAPELP